MKLETGNWKRGGSGWVRRARVVAGLLAAGTAAAAVAWICGGCVDPGPRPPTWEEYRHVYTATNAPTVVDPRPIEDGPLPRAVTPTGPEESPAEAQRRGDGGE